MLALETITNPCDEPSDEIDYTFDKAKQAITSLIKELVAEARVDELKHLIVDGGIWYQDMTRQFPQKITLNERIKELEA